jgi:hypothetical protein
MTLRIVTKPEAAVIYGVMYSDGQGGGKPPFGKGYGGEGSGTADSSGQLSWSWTVSALAPAGRAQVEIAAGWQDQVSRAQQEFQVAGADGRCG